MLSRKQLNHIYPFGFLFVILFFLFFPKYVNRGIALVLVFVFLTIYWAFFKLALALKSRQSKALILKLSNKDKSWDLDKIRKKVSEILNRIVKAKVTRNPIHVQHCISNDALGRFKEYIQKTTTEHKKNMIEQLELIDIKPISFVNLDGYDDDKVTVLVHYIALDYFVDDRTGLLVSGDFNSLQMFYELWKFLKTAQGDWVLTEIKSVSTIRDIISDEWMSYDL